MLITEKPDCISDKRNNCVLVALKEVTGKDDAVILAAVRKRGYRDNRGMHQHDYHRAASDLGIDLGPPIDAWNLRRRLNLPTIGSLTLRRVIRHFLQEGTWLVRTRCHVFVVRNGRLIDKNWSTSSLGRKVVDVTRVVNPHVAEKQGFVRVLRPRCRRRGTAAWQRFEDMRLYLDKNPHTTKEELLSQCAGKGDSGYDATDFAWDLSRGNIEIY